MQGFHDDLTVVQKCLAEYRFFLWKEKGEKIVAQIGEIKNSLGIRAIVVDAARQTQTVIVQVAEKQGPINNGPLDITKHSMLLIDIYI
jgi:hypothetical protein